MFIYNCKPQKVLFATDRVIVASCLQRHVILNFFLNISSLAVYISLKETVQFIYIYSNNIYICGPFPCDRSMWCPLGNILTVEYIFYCAKKNKQTGLHARASLERLITNILLCRSRFVVLKSDIRNSQGTRSHFHDNTAAAVAARVKRLRRVKALQRTRH